MANGFDRLERLFSKKKSLALSNHPGESVLAPPAIPVSEPQFPSPSFIRPRTTRMAARDEVCIRQFSSRSPSVPESLESPRTPSIKTQKTSSTRNSYSLYPSQRPLSAKYQQQPLLVSSIRDFQFPRPPMRNGEISPVSSTSEPKASFELSRRHKFRSRPSRKASLPLDTPPTSDLEDYDAHSPQSICDKQLPALPHAAPPTPGQSPGLYPILDSELNTSQSIEAIAQVERDESSQHLTEPQLSFGETLSSSSLESSPRASLGSSILREPDFNDFLSLSDDDIAESRPESPILPSTEQSSYVPAPLATPNVARRASPLLTLEPPWASRPATAAAYEAARIASKYHFDLVYVINLWPEEHQSHELDTEIGDMGFVRSDVAMNSPMPLKGRLLAAYGLDNVKWPFRISSAVHGRILRSHGWVEYRNQQAQLDDFIRGYACSFHTGTHQSDGTVISSASKGLVNRGIVFAAYRKPRVHGGMLYTDTSKVEMAKLRRDAETLVEMLLDIYEASRLRQPVEQHRRSDETGPMLAESGGIA